MNWYVFAAVAILCLGIEQGLIDAFRLGEAGAIPSPVLILAVFVCTWAPPLYAVGACVALGLALDLLNPVDLPEPVSIVGPGALAMALAGYAVVNFRGMLFKKNPLSLAFSCAVASFLASIVILAIFKLREAMWREIALESAGDELGHALLTAAYTGLIAMVQGPILNLLWPLFGFSQSSAGRPYGTRYG